MNNNPMTCYFTYPNGIVKHTRGLFVQNLILFVVVLIGILFPSITQADPFWVIMAVPISLLAVSIQTIIVGIFIAKLRFYEIFFPLWYLFICGILCAYSLFSPVQESLRPSLAMSLATAIDHLSDSIIFSILPASLCTIIYVILKKQTIPKSKPQ